PDRRQTAQPGARAAGATGEEDRRELAPILYAGRQAGSDQASALRPCSSIQARQPELTQAQGLAPTGWSRWNVSLRLAVAPAWPSEPVRAAQPATRRRRAGTPLVLVACSRARHAA